MPRIINLGGNVKRGKAINLREVCPEWTGRVSDEAKAEIEAAERRAYRVIQTAHLYRFGR